MQMERDIDPNNELAEKTLQLVDRLRPHANTILAAVGAGVLALLGWLLISNQMAAGRAQSWDALLAALASDDRSTLQDSLGDVVRRYPGMPAGQWAEVVLADLAVSDGSDLLFMDRDQATRRLQAAIDGYSAVLAGRPRGLLAERATFGMAKAREGMGQLDEARRGYETVVREQGAGGLKRMAESRVAALGRESTRQWYDWFAAQKVAPPQPAAAGATPDAGAATSPDDASPKQE